MDTTGTIHNWIPEPNTGCWLWLGYCRICHAERERRRHRRKEKAGAVAPAILGS